MKDHAAQKFIEWFFVNRRNFGKVEEKELE
jgi:hypothetical protein